MIKKIVLVIIVGCTFNSLSQNYPIFGAEKNVTINGLTHDAMEPFISPDGDTLFFNSLNSGGNTNLYYATKVNDTTFNYVGLLGGTYDSSIDHLDAVASHDNSGNFFWVSLRNYPTQMENLHRGIINSGNVSNITRVYGDFNIYSFVFPYGWLIMDAAIDRTGNYLLYSNALFDFSQTTCVGIPCEAALGIAQKVNDSTFNKLPNTDALFSNVNDVNYLVYAPQLSEDGLTLYFTRLQKTTVNTEICVSVRETSSDTFSLPQVIYSSNGFFPEAATVTTNSQIMYYHKKDTDGYYKIYMRYLTGVTSIEEENSQIKIYPNPSQGIFSITCENINENYSVISSDGKLIQTGFINSNQFEIDLSKFGEGIYFLRIAQSTYKLMVVD